MSCLFDNTKARWLRVLLPLLLIFACLVGTRSAQAATITINSLSAGYSFIQPDDSDIDLVSWSFNTTWDPIANPSIYCNYTTVLVAQYLDASGATIQTPGYNSSGPLENTWSVPVLSGQINSPGNTAFQNSKALWGEYYVRSSNKPTQATQIKYFYRLIITIADGSNVYGTKSQDSNSRTITIKSM